LLGPLERLSESLAGEALVCQAGEGRQLEGPRLGATRRHVRVLIPAQDGRGRLKIENLPQQIAKVSDF
jgi:hypothetical protein